MSNSHTWTGARLGDFFNQRQEPGRSDLPVMSVTMNDSLVLRDDLERRMESALQPEQHLLVRKGDIAYNMMRMWQGACGLAMADGMVSPAYVVLEPKHNIDSRFAFHWFKSARMIYHFWAYSHGLTEDRLRLYFDNFCEVPVSPPSLDEQRHIADLLDSWDRAIYRTEVLIAAKRQRKTGIISRILAQPNAKRGFIRDLASINPRNSRVPGERDISFVAMADVSEHGELLAKATIRRSELGNGFTQFAEGDILVAKITPCFENGKGALAKGLSNGTGFGTTEFHVIRPHDPADADYLHQITMTRSFRTGGQRHMTGSAGQRRVPAEFIEDFPLFIMGDTQRRNAGKLLAILDVELSNLDRTLSALRAQKQGLMQKLLTSDEHISQHLDVAIVSNYPVHVGGAV
jgi:type I restriction enzyme, S subunit